MSLPFPDRSWTRRKFPMLAMCIAALALAVPGARAMPAAVPVVAEPAPAAAPADLAGDVADAAAVGVPAPDAAKQEALPLALDPDAQVNLNEPADQAGAPAQPRDLAAQAPEAPASARSFSARPTARPIPWSCSTPGANGAGSASTTRWRPACSPLTAGP